MEVPALQGQSYHTIAYTMTVWLQSLHWQLSTGSKHICENVYLPELDYVPDRHCFCEPDDKSGLNGDFVLRTRVTHGPCSRWFITLYCAEKHPARCQSLALKKTDGHRSLAPPPPHPFSSVQFHHRMDLGQQKVRLIYIMKPRSRRQDAYTGSLELRLSAYMLHAQLKWPLDRNWAVTADTAHCMEKLSSSANQLRQLCCTRRIQYLSTTALRGSCSQGTNTRGDARNSRVGVCSQGHLLLPVCWITDTWDEQPLSKMLEILACLVNVIQLKPT